MHTRICSDTSCARWSRTAVHVAHSADVVQDGELHFSGTGSPSLSMAGPGTGVQWGAFRASSAIPGVTITNGRIDLKNVVVFGTAASGLSVQNGSITFSPNVKLDLSIGFFTVKEFQVSVGGSLTFDALCPASPCPLRRARASTSATSPHLRWPAWS